MLIDDDELRTVFQVETEEHLEKLDEGLLQLEQNPLAQDLLDLLFREAHSLKGSARMIGAGDIESIAHRFEDLLGAAKRGIAPLNTEKIDRLYDSLDFIRQMLEEALSNQPSTLDLTCALSYLDTGVKPETARSATPGDSTESNRAVEGDQPGAAEEIAVPVFDQERTEPEPEADADDSPLAFVPVDSPAPQELQEPVAETAVPKTPPPSCTVPTQKPTKSAPETIRVQLHQLDALMTQIGELAVTKSRIARRVGQVDAIVGLVEEWRHAFTQNQALFHNLQPQRLAADSKKLQTFWKFEERRLQQLEKLCDQLSLTAGEDKKKLELIADSLEDGIQTVRLMSLSNIFNPFRRMVRTLAREQQKSIRFVIEGADTTADKRILEEIKDPLMHILRNGIDHGIESPEVREKRGKPADATLTLKGYQTSADVVIEVTDDGKGIDTDRIKAAALSKGLVTTEDLDRMKPPEIQALIFKPGFSTKSQVTSVSGRGVGMDAVLSTIEALKGDVQVDSQPGQGTTVRLRLPISLLTTSVLIAAVADQRFAIPVDFVESSCFVRPDDIFAIEGRDTIKIDTETLSVIPLAHLLETPVQQASTNGDQSTASNAKQPCIILCSGADRVGILVDKILDEQEVIIKPHGKILTRVRNVSGSTILETGRICIVLNPRDLLATVRNNAFWDRLQGDPEKSTDTKQTKLLLVEDSLTTRTQEKHILEGAGYHVITAVDGRDAWEKLESKAVDAVITDVEMPNMDGFALTKKIRRSRRFRNLPVVLVTTLSSDEDKRRGLDSGADAYFTKDEFQNQLFLNTLQGIF